MERVRAEHGGKRAVAEWELLRVGDLEMGIHDAIRETNGLLDHLGREVDPDDGPRRGGRCAGCLARSGFIASLEASRRVQGIA